MALECPVHLYNQDMKFGNLDEVFSGDKNIYDAVLENAAEYKKPSRASEILTRLSHYGMSYSQDVYKNMHAIPANTDLIPKEYESIINLYGNNIKDNFRVKGEEDKTYAEKTIDQKREVLRKMAQQPEIEDILDIMANECVVYDSDNTYICQPFIDTAVLQMLSEENSKMIQNCMDVSFTKIYMFLEWKTKAWNIFKRYLIDGVLAYEIIYDSLENPHAIIGIVELDPATLTKVYENGQTYWYQFKDVQNRERKLLDAQVVYVKYEDSGVVDRTSYLERLIRPFNIYRIIEQAQVIWTVTQSSFKTMFTIPVGSMNKAKGTQTLMAAQNRYKEDITFNSESGEIRVNGKVNLPFNKEYFVPSGDNGTPTIETLVDQGPMLNDSDQLRYHLSKLYKMSKIPENRFDKEAQTTWFGSDATQQLRDEINFSRFVERIRVPFAELVLKPLRNQIALSIPDLKNDKRILDAISLRFNSYNQFEEMASIEVENKRIEHISNMAQSLTTVDAEGNEKPYFCMQFLIKKYLKMSDADLELNEKLKFEEQIANGDAENDEEGGDDEEQSGNDLLDSTTGGDEGGEEGEGEGGDEESDNKPEEGGESDESGDIDKEMMGDVKPESTEK